MRSRLYPAQRLAPGRRGSSVRSLVTVPLRFMTAALLTISTPLVVKAGPNETAIPNSSQTKCDATRFSIVIDVGHTPQAAGATSARGISEFTFNSNLGKALNAVLVKSGFVGTTLMTSTGVGFAQLAERAVRANELRPDLFLSLHHDSVQAQYLSRWIFEGKSLHYSDVFAGYSLFVASNNAYSKPSLEFAKRLSDELLLRGFKFSLHHAENIRGEHRVLLDPARGIYRYDELIVLRQARSAAVLFEAGIIVNRSEEVLLQSAEYQSRISNSILAAINSFCVMRQSAFSGFDRS
jgi:N-acetylmuramoyl-L-alanine amidase